MEFSHATFLKQAHKFLGDGKIFQFGIRSGDEEEFNWINKGHVFQQKYNLDGLDNVVEKLKDVPVYITIDLDVLDPSVFLVQVHLNQAELLIKNYYGLLANLKN